MTESKVLITKACKDYELLDSGEGEKLERFGSVVLSRPDPQALWHKNLPEDEWKKRGGNFTRSERQGVWELRDSVPSKWQIEFGGLKFIIKPTAFKHTGIFPEQSPNWEWTKNLIQGTQPEILNLFGYTGGATLACASVGAKVVHVDGSKAAINWAKENAEASGLLDKPIRWILDDAQAFVEREIKRGRKYDGIIMDPPAFGHGAKGELWKVEDHFLELLDVCKQVLSDQPLFFLINGYASGYSAISYKNNLADLMKEYKGEIEIGELTIAEKGSERLLPAGIFARWSKE